MNLGQLIEAVEFRSGFNDPTYRPTWTNFLNEAIRSYSNKYPWPGLEAFHQAVADGTRYLILPHFADTLISVLDRTNCRAVDRSGAFDREYPYAQSQRTAGTPYAYDKIGTVPALSDPLGKVYAQSTSGSDTGLTLTVTGYVSNSGASGTGLERSIVSEQLALLSTASTLTNLFTSFVSISKITETQGDIFLYDAGNSNRHTSFLARYETEAAFKRIQFLFAPPAGTLLELKFRHKIPPITRSDQAPHPCVDADYVINHTLATFWRSREQFTKGSAMDTRATDHLQDRAHKEQNFDEPFSQIIPQLDPRHDAYGWSSYW